MHKFLIALVFACNASITSAQTADYGLSSNSTVVRANESSAFLTLVTALKMAESANPDLVVAAREVEALEGAIRQAGIIPNPELATMVEDARQETRSTTVQLNQPIELGGKRSARIDAATFARDTAVANLTTQRAELRAKVIAAFYDVLIAQEYSRLTQASIELAQRTTTIAAKRVLAGKVSPVEETKAKIAESEVRMELVQAANELANARRQLAATWGGTTPRFKEADGQVQILPSLPELSDLEQRLLLAPALLRSQREIETQQARANVERSRQIPDITVSVGVKRNGELNRNQALLGLSIPIPLFDRNQGNLQQALSRVNKAQDERVALQAQLSNDLSQAYDRLDTTRREAELLQGDILPGAQSAYNAATKGFELGKFSFIDVLDAQRTLFQTKSHYLRALAQAHRSNADIERILGETSPRL